MVSMKNVSRTVKATSLGNAGRQVKAKAVSGPKLPDDYRYRVAFAAHEKHLAQRQARKEKAERIASMRDGRT